MIDGASGQIVNHLAGTNTVAVAIDGPRAYVGTRDDLQVLEMSDPTAPKLIGDYVDAAMDFERGLAVDGGLVYSPKGIFQYRPEPPALLLQAQSAGVTVNGAAVAAGSTVTIKGGERVTLPAPGGAAALQVRCSAVSQPVEKVRLLQLDRNILYASTSVIVDMTGALAIVDAWAKTECPSPRAPAASDAETPVLPLSLVAGGVQVEVRAGAGPIAVATTYASAQAVGGSTFQAGHLAAASWFYCLLGGLSVQPTAAGAPLVALGPGQFVGVTAAGAGPVGEYRHGYLPMMRR